MEPNPFRAAWSDLQRPYRDALGQAHQSLRRGGLAVGAAITNPTGDTVAVGRNRAYDPADGTDPLENTPLAHAELNALARIATDAEPDELTLWSTHEPCAMCASAAAFIGIEAVALATDPSEPTAQPTGTSDEWIVVATLPFLLGPGLRNRDHPMISQNRASEPETVQLVERILEADSHPLLNSDDVAEALEASWHDIIETTNQRQDRHSSHQ